MNEKGGGEKERSEIGLGESFKKIKKENEKK
jgi:hypothetical protein